MSDTYTKLFRSIAASTIVSEPLATRWLWITLLSQCDRTGCVYGSIPGLARLANISIPEVEDALASLMSPDPYSRTPDNEGRRLEAIDGGWRLLNYAKYDAMRNEAERREAKRKWDRENRPSGHARAKAAEADSHEQSDSPTDSPTVRQKSAKVRQSDPMSHVSCPISQQEQEQEHVHPAAARSGKSERFGEFWAAYPNRKGKQEAEKAWRKRRLDDRCDELLAHVRMMVANDDDWRRGYVPMGSTYLNQARWEDVPKRPPDSGPHVPPSRTRTAAETLLMGTSDAQRNLDQRRDPQRLGQAAEPAARRLSA